jgi:hypothetical protein
MPQLPYIPKCPSCGKGLDGYASVMVGERAPQPGDVTVCVYCCAVLQHTETKTLELADLESLPASLRKHIDRAKAIVRQIQRDAVRRN